MTREVVTATPDTSVAELARLMEKHRIKRVPITKAGKVVGIVSRSNLLQALASLKGVKAPKTVPSDKSLREKIVAQLKGQPWARPALMNVTVHDGTVELWGLVDSDAEKNAVRVLAEVIPGVRAVNDNLGVMSSVPAG
jgi:osmotically-inducible protein OsmY